LLLSPSFHLLHSSMLAAWSILLLPFDPSIW
jgi:hypothetical protein